MRGVLSRHIQRGQSLPKSESILEAMLDEKLLHPIDYAIAEELLAESISAKKEAQGALIAYLSFLSRLGHLCIKIENEKLYPSPLKIFPAFAQKELVSAFQALVLRGTTELNNALFSSVDLNATSLKTALAYILIKENLYIYFQKNWLLETKVLSELKRLYQAEPLLKIDKSILAARTESLEAEGRLLPEQAEAVRQACSHTLNFISGGPGTGKTYTAAWLIRVFLETLSPEQRNSCRIALAAPTGKAVANLQESLEKTLDPSLEIAEMSAKTLHSWLGFTPDFRRINSRIKSLPADLILVDESSMIDLNVMAGWLSSLKSGSRMIFLGDPQQLPPVEAGALFTNMIQAAEAGKLAHSHIALKRCMRSDRHGILNLASAIKAADSAALLAAFNCGTELERLEISNEDNDAQSAVVKYALSHFPQLKPQSTSDEELLAAFQSFRVLSPLRQGPLGVDTLNKLFARHFMQKNKSQKQWVYPIMVASNDYRLNLFNGEVGVVIKNRSDEEDALNFFEGDVALFPSSDGEGKATIRRFPALLLPKLELSYCLSVHKSQGSEFAEILLVMPEEATVFGREVLYTGVTRAKEKVVLYGTDQTLIATVKQSSQRLSALANRIDF